MTDLATEPQAGLPRFGHRTYGVDLEYIGEVGAVVAHGHVPPLRFLAALNHMVRQMGALSYLLGDTGDLLAEVRHIWAVNEAGRALSEGCEWWLRYDSGITEATPGAFPITFTSGEW